MPWFTTPTALGIIARLKKFPPKRRFVRDVASRNYSDGQSHYAGELLDRLGKIHEVAFNAANDRRPWPEAEVTALMDTAPSEIMAALFGDPDGLDWAHPDRAARRVALAAEIDAALAGYPLALTPVRGEAA